MKHDDDNLPGNDCFTQLDENLSRLLKAASNSSRPSERFAHGRNLTPHSHEVALRPLLAGIERADSITFDAHKFLSVPMSASMVLTRHRDILNRTFRIRTGYMPGDAARFQVVDPYAHSMQWSRRFIGLKLFLTLAVAGWEGYAETIRSQVALGDRLRRQLTASGWEVVNRTRLPVVCFRDGRQDQGGSGADLADIAQKVLSSGQAWISTAQVGAQAVLRACITNYRTTPEDVDALVQVLNESREAIAPA